MSKSFAAFGLFLASLLAATPLPAAAALGPDAPACQRSGPALIVNVDGFKVRSGNVRVNVYGSDPSRFLARGQYVRQINLRVTPSGAMPVCVALPRAGHYAVAVRHDVTGNGNDWGDGGGFSHNPRLSLLHLRHSYQAVAFDAGAGITHVQVVMNYRFGFAIRPVAG